MEKNNKKDVETINPSIIRRTLFGSKTNAYIKKINNRYNTKLLQTNTPKSKTKINSFYSFNKNSSEHSLIKSKLNFLSNNKVNNNNNNKLKIKSKSCIIVNLSDKYLNYISELREKNNINNKKIYIIKPRLKSYQNIIDNILNQKLTLKNPKINKLKLENLNSKKFIKNMSKKYGGRLLFEIEEKKYQQNERYIRYYFKKKYNNLKINKNIRSKSAGKYFNNRNNNNNNLIYEIIYETKDLKEKKFKYVNKLFIEEENNKNSNNNLNYHSLIKYPNIFNDNNISNDYNIISRLNSGFDIKKIKKEKNNEFNDKDNINEIKIKNFKKLEKNKIKEYIELKKAINEKIKNVKINREKYSNLFKINSKLFNNKKDEIIKNNL